MTGIPRSRSAGSRRDEIAARLPVSDAIAALFGGQDLDQPISPGGPSEQLLSILSEIRADAAAAPNAQLERDIPPEQRARAQAIAARLPVADSMAALLSEHNHFRVIETNEIEHREMLEVVLAEIRKDRA